MSPARSPWKTSRDLSSGDRLIAAELDRLAYTPGRHPNGIVWVSIAALGAETGLGRKGVRMALQNLEHFGFIDIVPNGYLDTQQEYHILWRAAGFKPETTEGPSPRERESARVKASKARAAGGEPVGAGGCNYPRVHLVGAGGRNYAPRDTVIPRREEEPSDESKPSPPLSAIDALRLLTRKKGKTPAQVRSEVRQAAEALGDELGNVRDFGGAYGRVAKKVAKGLLDLRCVEAALADANRPEMRNRGAVFNATLKREVRLENAGTRDLQRFFGPNLEGLVIADFDEEDETDHATDP